MLAALALACLEAKTDPVDTAESRVETGTAQPPPEALYGVLSLDGTAFEWEEPGAWMRLHFELGTLPLTQAGDCYTHSASTYDDYFLVRGGELEMTLNDEVVLGSVTGWPAGQRISASASGGLFPAFDLGEGLLVPEWVDIRVRQRAGLSGQLLLVSWEPQATGWVVVRVFEASDPESTHQKVCAFPASIGAAQVFADDKTTLWSAAYVHETVLPHPPTQGILVVFETGLVGSPEQY